MNDDALAELLEAIMTLRTNYELSRRETDDLEMAALRARAAHPGLRAGLDLLGQLEDVPEPVRDRLVVELRRAAFETRVRTDTPGQLIVRNCGYITGWTVDDGEAGNRPTDGRR